MRLPIYFLLLYPIVIDTTDLNVLVETIPDDALKTRLRWPECCR